MESGKRLKVEVDRLSSLPDDLIYKILSYVDIVYSIRLSVVSSRWRFIWTSMPNLNFASHSYEFVNNVFSARNNKIEEVSRSPRLYHKFVKNILSVRNRKMEDVFSVSLKLAVDDTYIVDNTHIIVDDTYKLSVVKRILEYAFSHNVQQLSVINVTNMLDIPPSRLKSKSLKHLTLIATTLDCRYSHSHWDLPALTTLHLHDVRLYNPTPILSMCQNLKNLTLERFQVRDNDGFTIINSSLVSLTLKVAVDYWRVTILNVDTPQLKNFIFVDTPKEEDDIIGRTPVELTISAPGLTYLRIKGYFPNLSLDEFPSLEKVDLCISSPQETNVHRIRDMFQRLHSVKSLALNFEIVERLSTSEEVISHQPSPLPSLKSLKIYPLEGLKTLTLEDLETYRLTSCLDMFPTQLYQEQEGMTIKLSSGVTNYLLNSSSNATFTMVSYEEARCIKITKVAYRLMAALWKILEELEAYTDPKRANLDWKKTLADSCREDFRMRIGPLGDNEVIFCILHNIKVLLTKVLASKRIEMQACFSRLCANTKTVLKKVAVDMKNQCDIKQSNLCGYVDEIAFSP